MGNVVPLRSKSEVRLRSAILSKLILLLLALTLQREKFKGVNAEDWPYTQENKSRMIKSYGNYQEKSENAWWFRRKCLILHTD